MKMNNQGSMGLTRYADIEICDFSKMQTSGMVTIRPIKENLRKETKVTIKCYKGKDPNTLDEFDQPKEVTFGIPIGTYPDNTPKFRTLTLRNQRTFNLQDKNDAMEFHVWRYFEEIQGSINASAYPRFMIFDPDADSREIYGRAIQRSQAVTLIAALKEDEAKDLARIFGIDPLITKPDTIKGRMVIAAEKNPEMVINIFQDRAKTEIQKIYFKAKAFGLITFEPMKGYMWKGTHPLGTTEEQAMGTLMRDSSLMQHASLMANEMERTELAKKNKSVAASIFKANDVREEKDNLVAAQSVRREVSAGTPQVPHETGQASAQGTEEVLTDNF